MNLDGRRIGPWEIDRRVGEGGVGMVFRCHHHQHPERLGALKVLRGGAVMPQQDERFAREARILRALAHPGVVQLLDVLLDHDPPCLVMEYVEGSGLDVRLAQGGPLGVGDVLSLGDQLGQALEYIHARGICHRDLKPANILLQPEEGAGLRRFRSRLVDFGIALESGRTRLTEAGIALGTVLYTPPEWISTNDLDPVRWDLFSLGVVLYEALIGHIPYNVQEAGGGRNAIFRILSLKERCLPLDPGVDWPVALRELLRDMTAPEPQDRLGSANELLRRLAWVRHEVEGQGQPVAWIRCVNGDLPGMRYPIRYGITRVGRRDRVGQSEGPEVDLTDQERNQLRRWVSRLHAELSFDGSGLVVTDRDSANGTFVNQSPLPRGQARRIAPGDVISFGRLSFVVEGT